MAEPDPTEALRAALDEAGEELAGDVVAQARREAIDRATSILADEMTRSVLDNARSHLSGATPKARPSGATPKTRRPRDREASGEPAYYVYGVAWAAEGIAPQEVDGVAEGNPPFALEHGRLAAIASLVPLEEFDEEALHENLNDVAWLERTARAHEAVLDSALASATLVPMRLCTIYRGEEQVREMLDREGPVFEDALGRLEGKTEWSVKLIAQPGALSRASSAGRGPADQEAGLSRGAAYMRGKRDQAQAREEAAQLADEWADRVHQRVAAIAAEALLNPLQNPEVSGHTGEMLLNGVYLVDDADEEAFREEVTALSAELGDLGASVELSGPWPPYNFVKGSIEAAR